MLIVRNLSVPVSASRLAILANGSVWIEFSRSHGQMGHARSGTVNEKFKCAVMRCAEKLFKKCNFVIINVIQIGVSRKGVRHASLDEKFKM